MPLFLKRRIVVHNGYCEVNLAGVHLFAGGFSIQMRWALERTRGEEAMENSLV